MLVNFSDFSWFLQHIVWDYQRSCCLAIQKILFYHKSCSIFFFSAAVLHSFPDSQSSLSFGIQSIWEASETNHIPSFFSHSQPGWQANAWLFWCKAMARLSDEELKVPFHVPQFPFSTQERTRQIQSEPLIRAEPRGSNGRTNSPPSLCARNLLNTQVPEYK